ELPRFIAPVSNSLREEQACSGFGCGRRSIKCRFRSRSLQELDMLFEIRQEPGIHSQGGAFDTANESLRRTLREGGQAAGIEHIREMLIGSPDRPKRCVNLPSASRGAIGGSWPALITIQPEALDYYIARRSKAIHQPFSDANSHSVPHQLPAWSVSSA